MKNGKIPLSLILPLLAMPELRTQLEVPEEATGDIKLVYRATSEEIRFLNALSPNARTIWERRIKTGLTSENKQFIKSRLEQKN